jgi:D-alanyl-D-alanine carboxypeptidase
VQGFFPRRRAMLALVAGFALICAGCGALGAPPASTQVAPVPASTALPALPTVTSQPTPSAAPAATAPPTLVPPTIAPTSIPAPTAPPATAQPLEEPFDPALAEELQRILDQLVADGNIPGAVLAVHIPGQEPWSAASGYLDRARSQPIGPTTRMRIASISKVFTAVVVLQLVEEGRLDLETPVSTWFPGLVPYAEQTTVRRLLNHTTGLYDYLEDRNYLNEAYRAPGYRWAPEELVAYAARQPSLFRPGTPHAWDYSSTNYVLLGMVVERVTGNTLAQEMRSRIFEPLDLEDTFFVPDEQVEGIQARGYRRSYDQSNVSLSFAFATANLVSTAGDVQRFGDALFNGRLLAPGTLGLMLTFENGKGQYNMPTLEYGLGVMRNQLPVGPNSRGEARPAGAGRVLGHTGGFAGFRSALWHEPESGITIALGMNQAATDPNILATQAFDAVLAAQGR